MQINKFLSARSCAAAWGQAVLKAIMDPPKEGEPSYELYKKERSEVFDRLKEKADLVSRLFNSIEGVRCNTVMG
jgi:alanine transaminase